MRDLFHHQIQVKVYDKSEDIFQWVWFYLDEVFPGIYEAETKMTLYVEPSDLLTDIVEAMIENKITGTVHKQIDFNLAPTNQYIHP